ncbi:hypothetical protein A4A71_09540 [Nicoletella semolina]|uniref:two-partner secretion domain-containing protein n=1 Tax=Nicoletella semolina TaxID=271160 RepID=UPI002448C497|nr:filamentous hemagglutinin N-terminal domain-containing protein [Nicoletella semolina]MDH2925542.1 hypothetical protein [Nicoletella semolina]
MNKLNIITLAIFAASYTNAKLLPQNGTVKLGDATISTQADNLTINQTSTHISIDWDSFDIGKNNSVEFKQPSDTAVAYNRVHSGNASEIQGKLSANGRVFLSNPNGVIFGKDAQVNVGALLATTKELTSIENLKEDNLKFNRVKHTNVKMEGKIVNNGKITVNGKNGFVVLVGDNVENNGEINAKHYSKTETVKKNVVMMTAMRITGVVGQVKTLNTTKLKNKLLQKL